MSAGPLRRLVGLVGLFAMAPIGYLLLQGRLTMVEAAERAVIVLLVVVVLGRITTAYLTAMARRLEPSPSAQVDPAVAELLASIRRESEAAGGAPGAPQRDDA